MLEHERGTVVDREVWRRRNGSGFIYREADGTTYWMEYRETGVVWMGCPTFADGTPDIAMEAAVADFDLESHEIEALINWLEEQEVTICGGA